VTSELLVCTTGRAAAAADDDDDDADADISSSLVARGRRSPSPSAPSHRKVAPASRGHSSVVVVIDGVSLTNDEARFSYVSDPVITDVISRDSFLRSVCLHSQGLLSLYLAGTACPQ